MFNQSVGQRVRNITGLGQRIVLVVIKRNFVGHIQQPGRQPRTCDRVNHLCQRQNFFCDSQHPFHFRIRFIRPAGRWSPQTSDVVSVWVKFFALTVSGARTQHFVVRCQPKLIDRQELPQDAALFQRRTEKVTLTCNRQVQSGLTFQFCLPALRTDKSVHHSRWSFVFFGH